MTEKAAGYRRWPLLKLWVVALRPTSTTCDSPFGEVSSNCIDWPCASRLVVRLTICGRGASAAFPFTVVNR